MTYNNALPVNQFIKHADSEADCLGIPKWPYTWFHPPVNFWRPFRVPFQNAPM